MPRKDKPASRHSHRACSNPAGQSERALASTSVLAADNANLRRYASELAALAPDVILAVGSAATAPLLQATRTVPIIFALVADPVGAGFVDSLARPGGNATGLTLFEYGISSKVLELIT